LLEKTMRNGAASGVADGVICWQDTNEDAGLVSGIKQLMVASLAGEMEAGYFGAARHVGRGQPWGFKGEKLTGGTSRRS